METIRNRYTRTRRGRIKVKMSERNVKEIKKTEGGKLRQNFEIRERKPSGRKGRLVIQQKIIQLKRENE